jgi:ADP-dependent NAD(P)H-hydrate dehydratase / NAD(P)H-hydrate epimerase
MKSPSHGFGQRFALYNTGGGGAMRLISVNEMKQLEDAASGTGYSYALMMENAGKGIASVIDQRFNRTSGPVLGLVGGGNNGGDTLLALAALQQLGWKTYSCLVKDRNEQDSGLLAYRVAGGSLLTTEELEGLAANLRFSIILDGVTGTGFKPPLADFLSQRLIQVRGLFPEARWVAIDCPSGTDCKSGEVSEATVSADLTICLEAVKEGLVKPPAFSYIGELTVVDLGLAKYRPDIIEQTMVISATTVQALLPVRSPFAHKGSFGKTMVVGGSENYCGAPILACKGAYAVGTGLVKAAVPRLVQDCMAGANPEITWFSLPGIEENLIDKSMIDLFSVQKVYDSIVIGPGLGTGKYASQLASGILFGSLSRQPRLDQPPFVIDADALTILATTNGWVKRLKPDQVLTPHPGEMSRLTGLTVEEIQSNRIGIARRYSQEWGQIVVLKGPLTVVAEPGGRATVIPIVSSALAKAGSGDVLAGMIGGYIAQGLSPENASLLGAWVHAEAGIWAASDLGAEDSVMPQDLIHAVPKVLQQLRR